MARSDPPVGRSWPPHRYEVGLEKVREYAHAIGEQAPVSHNREAARAAGLAEVAAPPTFAAVFCAPAVGAVIFDPEVGLFDPEVGIGSYRFVHKTQRFDFHRPVLAGDVITTTARLAEAHEHEDGRAIRVFESSSVDVRGEEVVSARYEGVVPPLDGRRSPRRADGAGGTEAEPPPAADPTSPAPGEALPDLRVTPDRYAPVRYAGASGDFTPFHLDVELARALGLPGVILHGLYSFALLARAHTAPFGGDPRVLQSLSGRFRRPAVPERELVVRTAVSAVAADGGFETGGEVRQGESSVIGEVAGRVLPAAASAAGG